MIGPLINSASIMSGAVFGSLFSQYIPEGIKKRMPTVFGIASMCIGIIMIQKVSLLPAMMLALIFGAIIGELLNIDGGLKQLGIVLKNYLEKVVPAKRNDDENDEYMNTFVSIMILFSFSGTGVFGAMNEGLSGDTTLLVVKSFLDFFTAIIFAMSLGIPVAVLALPQLAVQAILFFSASLIMPYTDPSMMGDFSAVGGVVVMVTGMRLLSIIEYPVANLLPGLFLVMPISALWSTLVLV
jgi:uncharacterized membrane protein YqgA involved in biofilm formation